MLPRPKKGEFDAAALTSQSSEPRGEDEGRAITSETHEERSGTTLLKVFDDELDASENEDAIEEKARFRTTLSTREYSEDDGDRGEDDGSERSQKSGVHSDKWAQENDQHTARSRDSHGERYRSRPS